MTRTATAVAAAPVSKMAAALAAGPAPRTRTALGAAAAAALADEVVVSDDDGSCDERPSAPKVGLQRQRCNLNQCLVTASYKPKHTQRPGLPNLRGSGPNPSEAAC